MKTGLLLLITIPLAFVACKKHEPAPGPIAKQPTDSLKNTLPPLDPPKSFVKHLLGTYRGKTYRKIYAQYLAAPNFVPPDAASWDVEVRVTEVDVIQFKVEEWIPNADSTAASYIVKYEDGDIYDLSGGAPILRELRFVAAKDSLYYTDFRAFPHKGYLYFDSTAIAAKR
jgi:hypothetical protein